MTERLESRDEQLLCVCEDLGRHVPGCEHLLSKYKDWWVMPDYFNDSRHSIKEDIRASITPFLKKASESEISEMIRPLKAGTKRYLAFPNNIPKEFRHHFYDGSKYRRLPNDLVAPSIFMALSKREKTFVPLTKTLKREYGKLTILVSGCLLSHFDALTLCALLELINYKKTERSGKAISFDTSLVEICTRMAGINPHSKTSQNAIWNSLKRLASVVAYSGANWPSIPESCWPPIPG
jgi:hypothetical protein